MASTTLDTLRDTLTRRSFDDAYYICGEDDFRKEQAMKQLIAAALDASVRDFNLDVQQAQDIDARSLDAILSSMPMMADRRIVVIRDAGTLRKDARKVLERYLERPSPHVLLLLFESAGGKADRELTQMTTVLDFDLLNAGELSQWIVDHAIAELGVEISADAVELLQGAVGNDLQQLVVELDKLASFTNCRVITEEAVAEVVGVQRGESMSDLLDSIARRDVQRALLLLDYVLGQPKTTGVLIVMALATQTVALAWGKAKVDEGLPSGRLQGEYFNLLKQSGSVYTGRSWATAAAAWASVANSWEQRSLRRAMEALLTADMALKETRLSSEQQVLTTLILTICAGDEYKIAA
jgi:DNA polymerase-3 subunit delta